MICDLKLECKGLEMVDFVVIFLYGYGVDGVDLLGLVDFLVLYLFKIVFYVLNVFEFCVNNFMGFQWFLILWMDGFSLEQVCVLVEVLFVDINVFIDMVLVVEGIMLDCLVFVGFLQGMMMLLEVVFW